jgi:Flp pilus assembly protein TadD
VTDPDLERIVLALNGGRYAAAEEQVRQVLAQRPDDEWALRILAACLTGQDRNVEALGAAQHACRAKPEQPLCWVQLANIHIALHEAPAAATAAERAVSLAPHLALAHHTLARAHLTESEPYRPRTAHDPQRALPAADEAVRLDPHNPTYRVRRAWALSLLERGKEAEHEYMRVLKISPSHPEAINDLGWLNRRRHPIRAAGYYARSLALKPQSEVAKMNLKGALMMWVLRLVWVWLWGGLALGVLRWVVPRPVCALGLVALGAGSLIGSAMMWRKFPRGALRTVWAIPKNHFLLLLGRLTGSVAVAVAATTAAPVLAVVANLVLVTFLLIEWKVDFTEMDQRFTTWVVRS